MDISARDQLLDSIRVVHEDCCSLCLAIFGKLYDNAGNIGIFCQNDEAFRILNELRGEITLPSDNPDQKYYTLMVPLEMTGSRYAPETVYRYLYIRTPDPSAYGKYRGDVDFYTTEDEYECIKKAVAEGEFPGASLYDRPGWDMIQLTDPSIGSVAYLSTKRMTAMVHVKQAS